MRYGIVGALIFAFSFYTSDVLAGSIEECNDRRVLTETAITVRDAVKSGKTEDSLLEWAGGIDSKGLRAAAYKAIEAYTFYQAPPSTSQVVSVMQYMCKKEYRP